MGNDNIRSAEESLQKASIINLNTNDTYVVMFNPHEYTLTKSADYREDESEYVNSTHIEFIRAHRRVLTMDLFFDTTDITGSGDDANVMVATTAIEKLMEAEFDSDGKMTHPRLSFEWGSFKFQCVLTDIEEKYTKFDYTGIPKRAILRCTFLEYVDDGSSDSDANAE